MANWVTYLSVEMNPESAPPAKIVEHLTKLGWKPVWGDWDFAWDWGAKWQPDGNNAPVLAGDRESPQGAADPEGGLVLPHVRAREGDRLGLVEAVGSPLLTPTGGPIPVLPRPPIRLGTGTREHTHMSLLPVGSIPCSTVTSARARPSPSGGRRRGTPAGRTSRARSGT